jgi:hypothetical protein
MVKKIAIFGVSIFLLFVVYSAFLRPRQGCKLGPSLNIDTVHYGKFSETIPFTGTSKYDSVLDEITIKAQIDELYFERISPGLKASTTVNNRDYSIILTSKDSLMRDGRFDVELRFDGETPSFNKAEQHFRMRLYLSDPVDAVLLAVGGFYKDTGGKFVYIVLKDGTVIKKQTVLGKKNPEHFQVLAGLVPGDIVITSSYEMFGDEDQLKLAEIKAMYEDLL